MSRYTKGMDELQLLVALHKEGKRQGPGSDEHTRLALGLSGLKDSSSRLSIADIGCGTGASTLVLASELDVDITAVDLFPEFLDILQQNASSSGLENAIHPLKCSMDALPFEPNSLDAIWSEGAIYNIGFETGIKTFQPFLKTGGILAVSEITWLTPNRPEQLSMHWNTEYPDIALASEKLRILETNGFVLKGYFPLPKSCWTSAYYEPLQDRFQDFLDQNPGKEAIDIIESEKHEIDLYKKYHNYYSYGFYIAEKQ